MAGVDIPQYGLADLFITDALDRRPASIADFRQEMLAIQELAARMADDPDDVLPRFVDLAMEITGGVSAGLSLFDRDSAPGVFHWRYLRGTLSPFEGATTPRDFSPCGVTLDQNGPVLSRHPERIYNWIADANIVVPEVLLVPLYLDGATPLGTLWIVSDTADHFNRGHARAMTELASFVGIALRMANTERKLSSALEAQETLAKEMSHRVKNVFAVMEGLIRFSARSSSDTEEMGRTLSGRLHALAAAHALVSRNLRDVGRAPRTSDIGALIRAVVLPHHPAEDDSRFSIEGPDIQCGDKAMNGIALIFHELTTNAAKYGALSEEQGRVEIRWREEDQDLVLSWTEQGGPAITSPPEKDGFGSTLVKSTVIGQFGGALDRDWNSQGLRVNMRMPLSRITR